jgi:hypothetical protein
MSKLTRFIRLYHYFPLYILFVNFFLFFLFLVKLSQNDDSREIFTKSEQTMKFEKSEIEWNKHRLFCMILTGAKQIKTRVRHYFSYQLNITQLHGSIEI